MAVSASFKQQCPSCEALVPIKDIGMVGKKIDCPKCKYRFVIEFPGEAVDPEEEEAPDQAAAKATKKTKAAKEGDTAVKAGKPKLNGKGSEALAAGKNGVEAKKKL